MNNSADYVPSTLHKPAYEGHGTEPFDLILEGGAMRGQFTAGVLDFFMDKGLFAQHVIGTSAGALCGYNYVAGEDGRTCYLNTKYCTDWRYLSMKSFVRTGSAFGVDFTFNQIPNHLEPFNYDAFRQSPSLLTTVASDIELGEADYHTFEDPKEDIPYLVASSSMPFVSKIVEVDDKKLLDGGVCDSVPLMFSMLCGTSKQVVILTQHDGYIKKPNKLLPLAHRLYSDYPYFLERMETRHYEYNRIYRRVKHLGEQEDIFLIRPALPVTIGHMESNPEKLFDLYLKGYAQAASQWDDLQRYLNL